MNRVYQSQVLEIAQTDNQTEFTLNPRSDSTFDLGLDKNSKLNLKQNKQFFQVKSYIYKGRICSS